MKSLKELTVNFLKEEEGTETVEWAIVAGLLIVAAAAVWSDIGARVQALMQDLLDMLNGGAAA